MTVVLHIGFHKTGSSAVQEFFYEDQTSLLEHGISYPQPLCSYPSHGELAWCFLNEDAPWKDRTYQVDEVCRHYTNILRENEKLGLITILSTEDLSLISKHDMKELATILSEFPVYVIIYTRDPVDYMVSLYNHAVAEGATPLSFRDFLLTDFAFEATRFAERIEEWADVFGRQALVVREYALDAVADFADMLGKPLQISASKRTNPGIHPWLSDAYRKLPNTPDGLAARTILREASEKMPIVDAIEHFLGNDVGAAFVERYRPPYQSFMRAMSDIYLHALPRPRLRAAQPKKRRRN